MISFIYNRHSQRAKRLNNVLSPYILLRLEQLNNSPLFDFNSCLDDDYPGVDLYQCSLDDISLDDIPLDDIPF